jgi:hypothetical protein
MLPLAEVDRIKTSGSYSRRVCSYRFITSFSDMKCCVAVILSVLLARTPAARSDIVVQIQDGALRGTTLTSPRSNRTFYAFMGIPYAKPPVQNLRFMVMHSSWSTYTPVTLAYLPWLADSSPCTLNSATPFKKPTLPKRFASYARAMKN